MSWEFLHCEPPVAAPLIRLAVAGMTAVLLAEDPGGTSSRTA